MDLTYDKALSLTHHDQSNQLIEQDFLANFPEGIVTIDRNGRICDVNNHVLTMFGYTHDDLYYKNFSEFIDQHYRLNTIDVLQKTLLGHTVKRDSKILHKSGYSVPVRINCIPIHQDGQIAGMYAVIYDLTEMERYVRELYNIKNRFVSAHAISHIGTWELDIKSGKMFWSDELFHIFEQAQWKNETITINKVLSITHLEDQEYFKKSFEKAINDGVGFKTDIRITLEDGTLRTIFVRADTIFNESGKPSRIIGVVQNITDLHTFENALESNREQLQKIYDSLDLIVCSFNIDHKRLQYVSKGIERMINIKHEQAYDENFNWSSFIHPADLKKFNSNRYRILRGEKVKHDYRVISRNSEIKWVQEQAIPIFDEHGKVIQIDGVLIDFTERKLHEQQMEFMASHDHLTGLKNRHHFENYIKNLIHQKGRKKFWLIYLDLDNFKSINDSLGYDLGDKVLSLSATKIEGIVEERGIAARLNGDEFVVVIHKLREHETIDDIATRLKESLERKLYIDEYQLQVTSSIGISQYPEHGSTLNELINNADRAVNFVKDTGKNAWQIFESNVEQQTYSDFELEQDLTLAIAQQKLELYLQPIVAHQNQDTHLAEALVRWKHPEHGYIPPNIFIPIAERTGLIHQIDDFVLKKTCEIIYYWKEKYQVNLTVTNNISPKRFLRQSFKNNVIDALKHFQVPTNQIIFEITETTLIHDPEMVNSTIDEFKKMGIRFALDDFGTGYSSIAHLSLFNIDFLKIDRQFIQNIHKNKRNQAILKGIMNFTNELKIPMIAEGIETIEELNFVKKLNCHYYQGFYFSKPRDLEAYKSYVLK